MIRAWSGFLWASLLLMQSAWAGSDPVRVAAAKELVLKIGFVQLTQDALNAEFRKTIGQELSAPELVWLGRAVTSDNLANRMAPIYADYLSAAQCRDIIDFVTKPPGNRFWRYYVLTRDKKGQLPPILLPAESRAIDAFMKGDAWLALSRNRPAIEKRLGAAWEQLGADAMADHLKDLMRSIRRDGPQAVAANDPIAQALLIALQSADKMEVTVQRFRDQIAAISLTGSFTSEGLYDADKRAETRRKLDRLAEAVSDVHRQRMREIDDFVARLRSLPHDSQFTQRIVGAIEMGIQSLYRLHIRWVEIQWRLVGDMRQIEELISRTKDKLELKHGQLIFADTEDLRRFQTLQNRLLADAKEEAAITQDMQRQASASRRTLGLE